MSHAIFWASALKPEPMKPQKKQILETPFKQLEVSEEFLNHSKQLKFNTLKEVWQVPGSELFKRKGFDYRWLNELLALLEEHDLLKDFDRRSPVQFQKKSRDVSIFRRMVKTIKGIIKP